jgi:Uma2 family endonuclease
VAITFEEFTRLNGEAIYELVEGRLVNRPHNGPLQGWALGRICAELGSCLGDRRDAYSGVSLDIPTLPGYGRCPDFVYYSPEAAAAGLDLESDRVLGPPTLVGEVVSPGDRERDLVTKRREYALVGIPHYWIVDPEERTVLTLALRDDNYEVVGEFSGNQNLTSALFPRLAIPLRRLFR